MRLKIVTKTRRRVWLWHLFSPFSLLPSLSRLLLLVIVFGPDFVSGSDHFSLLSYLQPFVVPDSLIVRLPD